MTIYLDYQATTPLAPEARVAMLPWLDGGANPHAAHKLGRAAKSAIEHARDQVAQLLPPNGQLYFTSGATEALNWAIQSAMAGGGRVNHRAHAPLAAKPRVLEHQRRCHAALS